MKKIFAFIVLIIVSFSCSEPCGNASTGPPGFAIEIVDKISGENVFTNGTYSENQLQVTAVTSQSLDYSFVSENNRNIIAIVPAWERGTFTTNVILNNGITIPIVTEISRSSSDCYTNYFIEDVSVTGYEFYFDDTVHVFKIKI